MEAQRLAPYKKNAAWLDAHIVFIDESGFLLIPHMRKTWAPRGQTPVHRHRYRRDKISAISGISVSPNRKRVGLYFQLHCKNIQQVEACDFLRHLLRHLRGHVIALWDNGKPHKGEPIRKLCRRFPRLHLELFPAYAPTLNPDEGVWRHLKHSLANGRPDNQDELLSELIGLLSDLRCSPSLLRSFVNHSELTLFFK